MRIKVGSAIYQSKALFKGYCRPSYNFNFIKGTLHNQQKKIQLMYGPTILDGLHNSRCSNHDCWAYFFIREHLNKALRYSQNRRILNYATKITKFFKAPSYS